MVFCYAILAFVLIALILAAIYRPLGDYMYDVYASDKDTKIERWMYRIIGVDSAKGQSWKAYFRGMLGFSLMSLLVLYLLQRVQSWLPYSLGFDDVPASLAFNTAASFVTNTNWQAYSHRTALVETAEFTAETRMSGLDLPNGDRIRRGLLRGGGLD